MKYTDSDLEKLKSVLREKEMPSLEDDFLAALLSDADTFREAVYYGALAKAENTSLQMSGLTTADQSSYFMRLAAANRPNHTGILGV